MSPAIVDPVEVRGRKGRIVDGHTVHNDQRLIRPEDRVDAADVDERASARVPRLLNDRDVGCFGRQALHDVRLAGALHDVRIQVVTHVTKLLGRGRGPGAGYDHLAQLQGVRREREVVLHASRGQRHLSGLRLVAEAPRHDRDGLARDPGARDDDHEAAVVLAQAPEAHGRDRDLDLRQRLAGIARDFAGDGDRLLRDE